jgi:hypothetical protein
MRRCAAYQARIERPSASSAHPLRELELTGIDPHLLEPDSRTGQRMEPVGGRQ